MVLTLRILWWVQTSDKHFKVGSKGSQMQIFNRRPQYWCPNNLIRALLCCHDGFWQETRGATRISKSAGSDPIKPRCKCAIGSHRICVLWHHRPLRSQSAKSRVCQGCTQQIHSMSDIMTTVGTVSISYQPLIKRVVHTSFIKHSDRDTYWIIKDKASSSKWRYSCPSLTVRYYWHSTGLVQLWLLIFD